MRVFQIFLFIIIHNVINCSKILIISQQPYLTNQKIASRLADDLATHGHKVTIFTSYYFGNYHENVDEFNFEIQTLTKVERNLHKNWLTIYHEMTNLHHQLSVVQMKHSEIKKIMKNERKFDLLIIDCVICQLLAIAEILDIPAIYLSANEPLNFINDHFGNEVAPSIHPETHALSYKHGKLTLAQRFNSYIAFHYWKFIGGLHQCVIMRQTLRNEFPNLKITCHQLLERLQFLFIFTHPAFGNVRPLVPKTIQIGFTYVDRIKDIEDKSLKKFLDASRNDVIVFNVEGLEYSELQVFMNVFSQLKQSIIINVENATNFANGKYFSTKNSQLSEIIGHPSVKLVISTADYREIEFYLKNRLPMLLVPLTHEQVVNTLSMVDRKVAKYLDITKINENSLHTTLKEMLDNQTVYKESVIKLQKFANERPKLKEMAIWHVEYVIRHNGAKHLDYPGRLVPYYQKMFLDIYLFFGLVFYLFKKLLDVILIIKSKIKAANKIGRSNEIDTCEKKKKQ